MEEKNLINEIDAKNSNEKTIHIRFLKLKNFSSSEKRHSFEKKIVKNILYNFGIKQTKTIRI